MCVSQCYILELSERSPKSKYLLYWAETVVLWKKIAVCLCLGSDCLFCVQELLIVFFQTSVDKVLQG